MYAKEIYNAAKKSTDPDSNPTLKRLLEKAKKDQVPSEIIKRAIDKVNSGVDESYEKLRYEVFGPSGSTALVDCLTDNVNRAISSVRAVISKVHFKLGAAGSVSYMYDDLCVLSFKGLTEDETLEALINGEVDAEIEVEDDTITLYGNPQDLFKIKNAILNYKDSIVFDIDEITTMPKEKVKLVGEDLEQFKRMLTLLDDVEDVQDVYHNVELE
jgi:YebC/PmpR family DNA-binding regulatory protein